LVSAAEKKVITFANFVFNLESAKQKENEADFERNTDKFQ